MSALLNVKQFVRFDEHGNLHVPNKLFVACQAYVQTPLINDTSSRVATTEWVRAQISGLTGISLSETDPIWIFEKALYYTKVQADARYLQSFTETDPTVPAWAKTSVKPTYTFAELLSKPTTIAGYGITDIPTTLPASDVYAWAKAATKPSYAYSEITGLPTLFSGSYTDLTNKPTLFSGVYADLTGKPTLFSGSYTDLTNKPTIPTYTLSGLGGQPLDADLTAIAALSGTTGFLKKTAADTWALDNNTYLTSYTETDPIWTAEKTNYALKTYVDTSISNLVASAPAALDTLNELALALGSDANFSTTVATSIGNRVPYTGATANVDLGTNSITLFNITSNNVLIVKNTGSVTGTNGFSSFSGNIANNGFTFAPNNSSYHRFIVPTSSNYDYTFPAATGTLALTSDIVSTYVLPIATTTALGGVKVDGTTILINASGVISGASTYTLPIASASALGGIKVGTNLSINATTGVLSSTDTTYAVFTGATALANGSSGLVTAPVIADRVKYLKGDGTWGTPTDTIYSLPTASATVLGGIKVGTNLAIDAAGILSSTDTVYTHPTTAGNKHIPAGGAAGQILRWSADGTAVWGTDTNTWDANSKDVAGYVAAPGAVANKVWKTDATGNPGWRDDADTDTNTTYTAGTGLTLTGTSFSITKTITASETADTIALRNGSGQLVASGFYQVSSRELKTNINPFTKSALDIIRDVAVVSFNYKTDIINKHIGFIAEDTPEELSTRNKNVMDTNNTIGLLLKAVQELEARIKQLESK